MRIAIVAPSPVPFTIGGAENFWWGLTHAINQRTPHQADLIKLPYREGDGWELLASYRRFSELDLNHFDLLISSKYPAWMVAHPNHYCYLQHKLRGLYDTYHLTGLPEEVPVSAPTVKALLDFMAANQGRREALAEFFERVDRLQLDDALGPEPLAFPGPLIRRLVHWLDEVALSPPAIKKYLAISRTVARRQAYFPDEATVEVVHHPSNLPRFKTGRYRYFLTVSRLDNAKRVRLMIEAMGRVESPVDLMIAGTGPEHESLRELAAGDPRIHFLGFVNDADLIDLYADALAVLYLPYDEDYGLVTIEAMMSEKPVITTTDAGGPNEFVVDGENGFSVAPDALALAEKMEWLANNLDACARMGVAGKSRVSHITWERTVAGLLPEDVKDRSLNSRRRPPQRRKLTVVNPFPVYPPKSGGQNRAFHLYRCLSAHFDIDWVCLSGPEQAAAEKVIAPGLKQVVIPKSEAHTHHEYLDYESKVAVPIADVALPLLYSLTPAFVEAIGISSANADLVIASHPYVLPAILDVYQGPIWYDAHNVEVDLKSGILPHNRTGRELLQVTRTWEERCCQTGRIIMTCSPEDRKRLSRCYQIEEDRIFVVPNGVDLDSVPFYPAAKRAALKHKLGFDALFIVLFLGSWHGPNLQAIEHVLDLAERMPDLCFWLVGSACSTLDPAECPKNALLLGTVEDEFKEVVLGLADVALNPMTSGSGTNLKVLEYLAAGIPVISTPFGIRGLDIESGTHLVVAEPDQFQGAIHGLRTQHRGALDGMVDAACRRVRNRYGWQRIAEKFLEQLAVRSRNPFETEEHQAVVTEA